MTHTLSAPVSHALEVKHSRFLARAAPVATPADALAFHAQIAREPATHHCWAYRIGQDYRSSDDGEPAGTAGRPILAAIDGQGFDQVIVVVTRWYGGIKLGAGGLVRAYGGAAAECLRTAPRVPLVAWHERVVEAPFDDLGALHAACAAHGAERLDETFDADGVRLRIRIPADSLDALALHLRDATRNRARIDDNARR
jgi:uncharacterized YigZ family protein